MDRVRRIEREIRGRLLEVAPDGYCSPLHEGILNPRVLIRMPPYDVASTIHQSLAVKGIMNSRVLSRMPSYDVASIICQSLAGGGGGDSGGGGTPGGDGDLGHRKWRSDGGRAGGVPRGAVFGRAAAAAAAVAAARRGRDWQILPATSSTRVLSPCLVSLMASYDGASNICQALRCGDAAARGRGATGTARGRGRGGDAVATAAATATVWGVVRREH